MTRYSGMRLGAVAIGALFLIHLGHTWWTDTHLDPFALLLTAFTAAFVALCATLSTLE
jgi:hypothetical protein